LQHRRNALMKITTAISLIRRLLLPAILFATTNLTFSQSKPDLHKDVLTDSRQMVLVTTKSWSAVPGTLQRFERKSSKENWRAVGSPIEIVVGRNGLAWGRGLYAETNSAPQKVEGDGKSPAGIFRLSSAFGFVPANEMKLKLPYLPVTEMLECVDDVKSARYNSIVDKSHIINPDWNSSEKMLEIGEAYRLGVVVDHNVSPRIPGKGSCIFIHIWKGDGSGTSGCTAMEKNEMEKFIHWLDAKANPVLAQFPKAEFQRLQSDLKLPAQKISPNK
jgi:L,D-peptidoglycan transpeptidase YkuD (ErfK/YbiS/YcfS/YnhG family)